MLAILKYCLLIIRYFVGIIKKNTARMDSVFYLKNYLSYMCLYFSLPLFEQFNTNEGNLKYPALDKARYLTLHFSDSFASGKKT